jgi:hypothetical protein
MIVLAVRDYNAVMKRAALFAMLAAALLGATVQARAAGGAMRGGGGRGGHAGAVVGRPGRSGFSAGNFRSQRSRNNALLYPLWYDEPLDYEERGAPEEFAPPAMMPPGRTRSAIPKNAPSPKITELPPATDAAASKPQPPAMFVLTNGERIEAQQYLLTYDHVNLTVDRQPRTIPLAMLDINATLAADRQRGIDLRIPAGRSEISLGF